MMQRISLALGLVLFLATNVNYGNPGATFGAPTFGRISSAGSMRQLQLGAKLMF